MDSLAEAERTTMLVALGEQRWKDFELGPNEIAAGFPSEPQESMPEELDPITAEFFEFYAIVAGMLHSYSASVIQ